MLITETLCDLLVDPQSHPRGQPHLSAASGLVRVHGRLYVVADDEHHLGVMADTQQVPTDALSTPRVTLLRLFEGDLPRAKGQRKAAKPDLEALTAVPPLPAVQNGALLALLGFAATREIWRLLAWTQRCRAHSAH
jgi:hypothetical protein